MRTLIDLKAEQRLMLDQFCAERNISMAKAIRMALNHFFKDIKPDDQKLEGQGLWSHKKTDGLQIQQELRDEWD
jgi:hypothetical protein